VTVVSVSQKMLFSTHDTNNNIPVYETLLQLRAEVCASIRAQGLIFRTDLDNMLPILFRPRPNV